MSELNWYRLKTSLCSVEHGRPEAAVFVKTESEVEAAQKAMRFATLVMMMTSFDVDCVELDLSEGDDPVRQQQAKP